MANVKARHITIKGMTTGKVVTRNVVLMSVEDREGVIRLYVIEHQNVREMISMATEALKELDLYKWN